MCSFQAGLRGYAGVVLDAIRQPHCQTAETAVRVGAVAGAAAAGAMITIARMMTTHWHGGER